MTFSFIGQLPYEDTVRCDETAALAEAKRAGVRVVMVTGDYPDTAFAIARAAGLDPAQVFARVMPEEKLALVQRFKAEGQVVAMTGDGINDAPALAAAHIGIAMGRRGTDVAREAADLILLDDRFASIIGGIRLGRRIFANLRRAMTYIAAIHVPIAGLALLPILLGLPPLLYPMHVVLLELVIDPLCSLAFEAERDAERDMARPPRPAGELLFGRRDMLFAVVQGLLLLGAVLGLYAWGVANHYPEGEARAAAFLSLMLGNLGLALANASGPGRLLDPRRGAFWIIGAFSLLVLSLCLLEPSLRDILRFAVPSADLLGLALGIGAGIGVLVKAVLLSADPEHSLYRGPR